MNSTTYAQYSQRVLASLIDGLILIIPYFILQAVLSQLLHLGPLTYAGGIVRSVISGGLFAGYNYYFLIQSGQTPGKKP